jgi:hypothetical protein
MPSPAIFPLEDAWRLVTGRFPGIRLEIPAGWILQRSASRRLVAGRQEAKLTRIPARVKLSASFVSNPSSSNTFPDDRSIVVTIFTSKSCSPAAPILNVLPNSDTLLGYLLAVFLVFLVVAYFSLAAGRIAYVGRQTGITFALTFAGLGPAVDAMSRYGASGEFCFVPLS